MLTVLVTGPTVTQDSPFSSLAAAITVASTHFAYPRRNDQAELAWVQSESNLQEYMTLRNEKRSYLMFKLSSSCNHTSSKSFSPLCNGFVYDAPIQFIPFVHMRSRSFCGRP